jgi:hypothetical protein
MIGVCERQTQAQHRAAARGRSGLVRLLLFRLIGCQLILPAFLGVGAVAEAVHPLPARVEFLQVFAGDEKKWQRRSGSAPPLIRQPGIVKFWF